MHIKLVSLSLGLLLAIWALLDDPFLGGGLGFGGTQLVLLVIGLGTALSVLLPIEMNKIVLTAAISTGIALGVAELLLRASLGQRYYTPFQIHSEYIYNLIPGVTREYQHAPLNGGGRITYKINDSGFRGPPLRIRENQYRIVVYGDSFIQAEFSEHQNTFPQQLEAILEQRITVPVEVINAGVAGYGPDQAYLRLEDEIGSLDPDLVVFSIYAGNDFGDLIRNKLFRMQGDRLARNDWHLDPVLERNLIVSPKESIIKKMLKEARDVISTPTVSRTDWDQLLAHFETEFSEYARGDDTVRELLVDHYNADFTLTPEAPSVDVKTKLMGSVISHANQLADAQGVSFLLLIIPHPTDVFDGQHASGTIDLERFPQFRPEILTDTLQMLAERTGTPFVNLYSPFKERKSEQLYLKGGDDHWNDLGQRIAAELVADRIVQTVVQKEEAVHLASQAATSL